MSPVEPKYQPTKLPFNPQPSMVMHLDLNSCFATIEQQANPLLRGQPIAVAAYTTPSGCILAASVEAKKWGVQTGLRVKDGKRLCSGLIVLPPDPGKYRHVHLRMRSLLNRYTDRVLPRSIDEFVLDLEGCLSSKMGMRQLAREIKQAIRREIGEWLTVSVGIAPNRFLAKTASGLHKPDGLDEINQANFKEVYQGLKLTDLCGIKNRNLLRLSHFGICTVSDFYQAELWQLRAAFHSIVGYYWYLRLRGWEVDNVEFGRRSYGNSYALPKPLSSTEELAPILQKLVEKTGSRLRRAGYRAKGVHLRVFYRDRSFWHQGHTLPNFIFDSREIFREVMRLLYHCPYRRPVAQLAVSCFHLERTGSTQLEIFTDTLKKIKLSAAIDQINARWGSFVLTPARMLGSEQSVPDRIAFGGVKELEEFTLAD